MKTIVERFGIKKLAESKAVKKLDDAAFFKLPYCEMLSPNELAPYIGYVDIGKVHHTVENNSYRVIKVPLTFSTINIFKQGTDPEYFPILCPLSDISDEHFIYLAEMISGESLFTIKRDETVILAIHNNVEVRLWFEDGELTVQDHTMNRTFKNIYKITPFLCSKGYDVFNWIEKGRAFNKSKINK